MFRYNHGQQSGGSMSQSRGSEYARFVALLPELVAVVLRRDNSPERMASAGARLGGLLVWGVEQARFCAELTGSDIAEACRTQPFRPVRPVDGAGYTMDAELPRVSSALSTFKAAGSSGEPLEILVWHQDAEKIIAADGMIAYKLVKRLHSRPKRMSAADLAGLFRTLAVLAAQDAGLSAEADGLQLGSGSKWLIAPSLVERGDRFLVERALPGCLPEDLPAPSARTAYHRTVRNWAWMLLQDGVLQTSLRRDQIRFQDDDSIGVTRWAGAYRPGPAIHAFAPTLAQAAFGSSAADRARHRTSLLGLLAHGLGITGALEDLADLCLALISQGGPLQVSRPLMPGLFIREQGETAPDRIGFIRLLRQLAWFRDLGQACGAADLSAPWQELAHETRSHV
jgi:hypothetical protein